MTKRQRKKKRETPAPTPPIRTEAELESRIAAALHVAFPNIPRDQLTEQHHFSVRLGHETHEFDSSAMWKKSGRADILIFHEKRPLAVLEIKRENLSLTHADYEQAQSYANQITPRPPLVIVTNGEKTQIYDSNTGQPWSGENDAAKAVTRLLTNAAKIAVNDMRWATEALMGREAGVWARIVRASTARLIADMTDPPGKSGLPFTRDLLFPRSVTLKAKKTLLTGPAFTIISGAPVAGKTSILRELVLQSANDDNLAVLMLRGSGSGLFQSLANLFAAELEWNIAPNDARQWLRRMSTGSIGPTLVVAIDGVDPETPMAMDLEELANLPQSNKLRIIITTDQSETLVKTRNGRTTSALGRHATEIEVGPLGLEEFQAAQKVLENAKVTFQKGSEYASDYRAPWVLRTIYDSVVRNPKHNDPALEVLLPPSLGINWVDVAKQAYADQPDLLRSFRLLARDALADTNAQSAEITLTGSNGFVIRQDALSAEARQCITKLRTAGWIRSYRHVSGEDIVVPSVPAAFLSELAEASSELLEQKAKVNPYDAGVWLGHRLGSIYLGDVVGAQAIRSLTNRNNGLDSQIISGLLSIKPKEELIEDALIGLATTDGTILYIKVREGKAWISNRSGELMCKEVDLGAERSRMYSNTTAWMILGQFARLRTAVVGDDSQRMDAWLLHEIGQCPFPLLRVNEEGLGHLEHNLGNLGQVLCQDQGAIETVTQAMVDLFSRPWDHADDWIVSAIETGSLPLIHRVSIALHTVRSRNIPQQAAWADDVLKNRVHPAITAAIGKSHD